jgi:hypothetical protein
MIDPDMKELAETLKGLKPDNSSLSIGWATVFGILLLIFGFLFGGFVSNRMDITRLQEKSQSIISWQEKMEPIITAIRDDQKRREKEER